MIWGERDVSVSFCEDNYNYYIAEFYNTFSSFCYLGVGLYFINSPLKKIAYSILGIGMGSILLHGTQRKYGQWLDEMSMISASFFSLQRFNPRIKGYILVPILLIYLKYSEIYFMFLIPFVGLSAYLTNKLFWINIYGKMYSIAFILGWILWILDQGICEHIKHLNLHAWWHILSAVAIFFGFKAMLN